MNTDPRNRPHSPGTRQEVTRRLVQLLVERELLSYDEIEELEHRALWLEEDLDNLLQRHAKISQETVRDLLAEITGIQATSLVHESIDPSAIERVPATLAVRHRVFPLGFSGNSLVLACDQLVEASKEEQLRILTGQALSWRLCTMREMDECIKHFYGVGLSSFIAYNEGRGAAQSGEQDSQPEITGFVKEILRDAIASHATDIHIEPYEEDLRLRYRLDGVLYSIPLPEGAQVFRRAIVSSIKVMSQLNIAEKRLPQDGRFSFGEGAAAYDIRVSVLPTRFGEAVNLRILNHKGEFLRHQDLGMTDAQSLQLQELLGQPYGIILFTGPTGSGKTTSLYASLEYLNRDERKIITLEDPIEYRMPGTVQLQVHPEIGFTFPAGLRSILRHDPDVVLIGEIRDEETARIAISAALTGHLVFSTLHTNDSVSAATRLTEMGIEPYLLASGIQGIIAQRLLRRVCPDCKTPESEAERATEEIKSIFRDLPPELTVYRGKGCPLCRFMGYRGRQAVFELLTMRDDLRKLVIERASGATLLKQAVREGLITLRQGAWAAALAGITTPEEVLRLTRGNPPLPVKPSLSELLAQTAKDDGNH